MNIYKKNLVEIVSFRLTINTFNKFVLSANLSTKNKKKMFNFFFLLISTSYCSSTRININKNVIIITTLITLCLEIFCDFFTNLTVCYGTIISKGSVMMKKRARTISVTSNNLKMKIITMLTVIIFPYFKSNFFR